MKARLIISGALLSALFLAGCSTPAEKIYFVSETKLPAVLAEPSPVVRGLTKADEEKIDLIVLSALLEKRFWEGGHDTALFLQADDKVVGLMIQKYPQHNPPIKPSTHIDLSSNQAPLDKDTGQPGMILGADASDLNADGTVDVIGRWFAGHAVQGFYTFKLKKTGEDWQVISVK